MHCHADKFNLKLNFVCCCDIMRLSIVSPAPGYPGTSGVLAVYCRGFVLADVPAGGEHVQCCGGGSSADIPAGRGTMYRLAAVAQAQTSRPGGDHVRGCGGGSMVFIWAGNLEPGSRRGCRWELVTHQILSAGNFSRGMGAGTSSAI